MSRRRQFAPLAAAGCLLAVTGCGASEPVPGAAATNAAAPSSSGGTRYPLTVSNCGKSITVDAPPKRVVSLDQDSTEILLSLGLKDRIAGTASWTDPVLPSLAQANAGVKRLADNAPTYEVVLGTDPDFVTASFGRHFAQGGVATRDRFAETKVGTYLSPTDCDNDRSVNAGGTRTAPLTTEPLHQEIRELARIFDVAPRGEQLVAALRRREQKALAGVDAKGTDVAFWFADTKTPFLAGGRGAPALLARKIGATNTFDALADDWVASSWEALVQKNPDVLVLGDLQRDRFPGDRLADKIAFLKSDPLTKNLDAVKNNRFVALHGAELNPSIRYVDGLDKLGAFWREHGADVR